MSIIMKQFHRKKIATILKDQKTSNLYLLLIRSRPSTELIYQAVSPEMRHGCANECSLRIY